MRAVKLGKREVDGLACPPGRRDALVFDEELAGFGVRVNESGAKVYLFQYRAGRIVRRFIIGRHGEITPAQARKVAVQLRGEVASGADPAAERKARHAATATAERAHRQQSKADAFTLAHLVDRWAALGLQDRGADHRGEAPRAVRSNFAGSLAEPAHSLDPATVQRVLDGIARTRPVMARRLRDYARAMYNWGIKRRLLTINPFATVVVEGRERSRDRVLSDAELAEAWHAAGGLGYPFGPFLQLVILTLQRRGEVAGMRWGELSPDFATWTIPAARAKNGKAHIVHLAEPARGILLELRRFLVEERRTAQGEAAKGSTPDNPASASLPPDALVFTTTGTTEVSAFSRAKTRLHEAIETERAAAAEEAQQASDPPSVFPALDWRVHDFRRTGVTTLARLGIAPHVADRLLNHVQGTIRGVAAVYQRHDFLAEREAAMKVWAAHIIGLSIPAVTIGLKAPSDPD